MDYSPSWVTASMVMFKILQARLQQYMKQELPDVQAGFWRGRGTINQIANICWVMQNARRFQKHIYYFCFIDYTKAFDCVDHNKLWKILKDMRVPDHLTCLLTNLYAGQEATVRTGHGTMDWFQTGKGVCQGCILSPCLFNQAGYIMGNARTDESQAGIKTARKKINKLRYANDATLMAESKDELKSLLRRVKKLAWNSTFKKLRQWHPVTPLHDKEPGESGNRNRYYFLGLQDHCGWWLQPWKEQDAGSLEEKLSQT